MTQSEKKWIGKSVVMALAVLVIILGVSTTCVYTHTSPEMRVLAITIGVDYPFFDQLVQLINTYAPDFHGFTFVIDPLVSNHTMDFSWALGNQTRLEFLERMGDVIPFLWGGFFYAEQAPPLQSLVPSQRIAVVEDVLAQWINYTGRLPDGVFCWQPDTFTLNYLETRGIQFNIGYCFDQYVIDYMTMRGGWQEPYYASSWNALAPNNQTEGGVVILPYVTWDWVDSFTRSHLYNSEPFDTPNDVGDKVSYIETLIERTMASSQPIGYAAFSFFTSAQDNWTETGQILKHLIEGNSYQKMTVKDFVTWFKMNYATTPTYHVYFTSPHDGQSIEWYYSTQARIARANGTVLSYVDYRHQKPDPYLTKAAETNFSQPRSPTNSIDNSLNFTIDALGGGQYRHPIVGTGVPYSGPLEAFPEWYACASDDTPPNIDTPAQDPPPTSIQPFQNVKVSVNVTDFESGVRNVTLQYKANEGEWITKTMQLNATTGLYEAIIDGYDAGTKITYMITAYDNAGNKAQQDNAGSYFVYTVIPELQLIHDLLALILIATITMALARKAFKNINSTGQTA